MLGARARLEKAALREVHYWVGPLRVFLSRLHRLHAALRSPCSGVDTYTWPMFGENFVLKYESERPRFDCPGVGYHGERHHIECPRL